MDIDRVAVRARVHGALSDPYRLAIVDALSLTDATSSELAASLGIGSNLLAHHLSTLDRAGLIERVRSQGDQRRRYLRLRAVALEPINPRRQVTARRVVFVCTENAARSQLAQALWNAQHAVPAVSGGTRPARHLHSGAVAAARRQGLDLADASPGPVPPLEPSDLLVTVCDRANEHLGPVPGPRLHWSVPDPASNPTLRSYDAAAQVLKERIDALSANLRSA